MTDLIPVISDYMHYLAKGKCIKAEMMKQLAEVANLLDSDCDSDTIADRLRELSGKGIVSGSSDRKFSKEAATEYIMSADIPKRVKEDMVSVLTDSHRKKLVVWVVEQATRDPRKFRDIKRWFKYPQWRVPFLKVVWDLEGDFGTNLTKVHPALCEHFIPYLLQNTFERSYHVFGSFDVIETYVLNVRGDLRQKAEDILRKSTIEGGGWCSRSAISEVSSILRMAIPKMQIPDDITEFNSKYFVSYSKILEYKEDGADMYKGKSVLDVWAAVTSAEYGGNEDG